MGAALIDILATMPPGTLVPAAWVRERLERAAAEAKVSEGEADLGVAEVGRLLGRKPSTVRGWCRLGRFHGAYRLNGKDWRIPPTSVQAFRDGQRVAAPAPSAPTPEVEDIGQAWRTRRGVTA